jgi:hypothetical protein
MYALSLWRCGCLGRCQNNGDYTFEERLACHLGFGGKLRIARNLRYPKYTVCRVIEVVKFHEGIQPYSWR